MRPLLYDTTTNDLIDNFRKSFTSETFFTVFTFLKGYLDYPTTSPIGY